jgi:hypothetical protein
MNKKDKIWATIIIIIAFFYIFNAVVDYKVDKIYEEVGVSNPNSMTDSDCSSNKYNCGDFSTYTQAKAMFDKCGGVSNDIHYLDGDDDGIPCESLR